MEKPDILFCIGFGAVATFIVTMMFRDWFRRRRLARKLTDRAPYDDEFHRFFPDPKRADVAVRVRRVLAANLQLPSDRFIPSDRLNDDFNAELAANPDLFWELEAEFGIKTDVDDLDSHEKTLERIVTFGDLVEYIELKLSEPAPPPSEVDEEEPPSPLYRVAIRSIPFLCVSGFGIAVASIVVQNKKLLNAGGLIFLSGIMVWGLANGGEMLRGTVRSLRNSSFKEIISRPWSLILTTGVSLFFLWVGGFLLWGILKNLLSAK
ncbi:MAG TPA: hypothetical protein VFZ59_03180 [Verrucomicrobiae bacterium]|nr:hypothetical protein [Verrucomicrobiae bacterium]